jgi:hypothetical protein
VTRRFSWPALNCHEDQKLFEDVRADDALGGRMVEGDALVYVHRRHDSNASAERNRQDMWQGVMPLQLAGDAAALGAAALVAQLVAQHPVPLMEDAFAAGGDIQQPELQQAPARGAPGEP